MKRILSRHFLAAVLLAALPLATARAVSATPAASTAATTVATQRLANLKAKGAVEIDRRTANLTAALSKVDVATKLTATDKAALTKQVQDELTALATLKQRLAAETELAAARTDIVSMVTDYRVYALMLPKVRLVALTDRFVVQEDKLTTLQAKLQAAVTAKKSGGQDTASLQASLDKMGADITASRTQTAGLTTKLLPLQPSDYNANHKAVAAYRDGLKTAQASLKSARDNAETVLTALAK